MILQLTAIDLPSEGGRAHVSGGVDVSINSDHIVWYAPVDGAGTIINLSDGTWIKVNDSAFSINVKLAKK